MMLISRSYCNKVSIRPICAASDDVTRRYFRDLHDAGRLKYRFSDMSSPDWADVREVITRMEQKMFFVYDRHRPVAEFTFDATLGKTTQIHFSVHPSVKTGDAFRLMSDVTDEILQWGDPEFWVDALWGLTPLAHRVGCISALKAGFKKIGILPSSVLYFGEWVDAMISIKRRPGWEAQAKVVVERRH
jgi:hypothetical protein